MELRFRNIILIWSLCLFGLIFFSGSTAFLPPSVTTKNKCLFYISKGNLFIKGKTVEGKWKMQNYLDAFGKPDRIDTGSINIIHTWDSHGFKVFQSADSKLVLEVQLYFHQTDEETDPSGTFSSIFGIEKMEMKENTTTSDIRTQLPEYEFTQNESSCRGALNGIYVYRVAGDNGKVGHYCFGEDDGDPWK